MKKMKETRKQAKETTQLPEEHPPKKKQQKKIIWTDAMPRLAMPAILNSNQLRFW